MPNLSCYQSKNIDLTLYKSGPYCISTSFWTKRAKTCSVLMSWNSLIKMAIYVRLSYRTTWYCSKLYKVSERCQMLVKRLSNYDFIFCAHRSTVSDDTTGCNVIKKKKRCSAAHQPRYITMLQRCMYSPVDRYLQQAFLGKTSWIVIVACWLDSPTVTPEARHWCFHRHDSHKPGELLAASTISMRAP